MIEIGHSHLDFAAEPVLLREYLNEDSCLSLIKWLVSNKTFTFSVVELALLFTSWKADFLQAPSLTVPCELEPARFTAIWWLAGRPVEQKSQLVYWSMLVWYNYQNLFSIVCIFERKFQHKNCIVKRGGALTVMCPIICYALLLKRSCSLQKMVITYDSWVERFQTYFCVDASIFVTIVQTWLSRHITIPNDCFQVLCIKD